MKVKMPIIFILTVFLMQNCVTEPSNDNSDLLLLSSMSSSTSKNTPVPDKKIFVSQATTNGNIAGLSFPGSNVIQKADSLCMQDSLRPDSSTYKAMIVDGVNRRACVTPNCTDPNENIDWVFKPNTKYGTVNGTYLFTTNSGGVVPYTTTISNHII